MRDWKLENSANGKEISAIPFGTEKEDYLRRKPTISEWIFRKRCLRFSKKSGDSGWKSNGTDTFVENRSEIVEYLPQ